jgi:hypothetical protein
MSSHRSLRMLSPGDWASGSTRGASPRSWDHPSVAGEPASCLDQLLDGERPQPCQRIHRGECLIAVQESSKVAGRPQRRGHPQSRELGDVAVGEAPLPTVHQPVPQPVSGRAEHADGRELEVRLRVEDHAGAPEPGSSPIRDHALRGDDEFEALDPQRERVFQPAAAIDTSHRMPEQPRPGRLAKRSRCAPELSCLSCGEGALSGEPVQELEKLDLPADVAGDHGSKVSRGPDRLPGECLPCGKR